MIAILTIAALIGLAIACGKTFKILGEPKPKSKKPVPSNKIPWEKVQP